MHELLILTKVTTKKKEQRRKMIYKTKTGLLRFTKDECTFRCRIYELICGKAPIHRLTFLLFLIYDTNLN